MGERVDELRLQRVALAQGLDLLALQRLVARPRRDLHPQEEHPGQAIVMVEDRHHVHVEAGRGLRRREGRQEQVLQDGRREIGQHPDQDGQDRIPEARVELVDREPDHLGGLAPEDPRELRVDPAHDQASVQVDQHLGQVLDQALHEVPLVRELHRLDQELLVGGLQLLGAMDDLRLDPRGLFAQRGVGGLEGRTSLGELMFGILGRRDVFEHDEDHGSPAGDGRQARGRPPRPDDRTVLAQVALLELGDGMLAGDEALEEAPTNGKVLGMHHAQHVAPQQFIERIAEEANERMVAVAAVTPEVEHGHAHGGGVEDDLEVLLARAADGESLRFLHGSLTSGSTEIALPGRIKWDAQTILPRNHASQHRETARRRVYFLY